ncbi:hypothetical protein OAA64_00395 [bacterium]|jgi:hypothetical protein|nr:hypothetical protein [bacterium]|tara:strand:- start:13 stop:213 length:201 start_codon:yes stop_codon:yes gene_type:complete
MQSKSINKILDIVRSYLNEQPTNNISGGKIAGSVEAGDDPPVRLKKKKKYIYMKGVRKTWTPEKNG